MNRASGTCETITKDLTLSYGCPRGEEKECGDKEVFEEIIAENIQI